MIENIVFYCRSKKVGGEQLLYYRCADWLTGSSRLKVWFVDYQDGFIRTNAENNKILFVDNIKVPANSVVILPLSGILLYDKYLEVEDASTTKYLFWSLHPENLTGKFKIKGKFILPYMLKKRAGKIIRKLSNEGVIRFMDYQNYHSVCHCFGLDEEDIEYMPIPFGDSSRLLPHPQCERSLKDKETLSFLWVSRIMPDKLQMIFELFQEIASLHINKSIILHIVGDGSCENKVLNESKKYNFKTIMHGRMTGDELQELIDKIDIGVSVGTSALEIAKRCKPVIIGTPCLCNKPGKKKNKNEMRQYVLLSQEYGFSVGTPIKYTKGQNTFDNLVDDIISSYNIRANECWTYVKNNHSMENVGEILLKGVNQLELVDANSMYKDLDSLRKQLLPMCNLLKSVRNI